MSGNVIKEILLSSIVVNPYQPRRIFNEQSLNELADSIAVHGLIQPIIVRKIDVDKYEIVAGERRYRAFELLGEKVIPAIIKEISIKDSSILALIENIQRDDLHFIEEAKSYESLLKLYNWTQEELSSMIGRSQSTIANKVRLLNFSQDAISKFIEYSLTERHARALLPIKSEKSLLIAIEYIHKNELSVKQTENYVTLMNDKSSKLKKQGNKKPQIKTFIKDIRLFTNTIKQAVDSINTSGVNATYSIREEQDHYTITIDIPMEK